jgi:hypothetical protein
VSEPHVEVTATVRDRHGEETTEYVGSMPTWAWEDKPSRRAWTKVRRTMVLDNRTSDPRGWRVTFSAEQQDDDE